MGRERGRGMIPHTHTGGLCPLEVPKLPQQPPVLGCPHGVCPQASSLYPLPAAGCSLSRSPVPGCPCSPGVHQQHPKSLVLLVPQPWVSLSSPPQSPSVPSEQHWGVLHALQQHPIAYICPPGQHINPGYPLCAPQQHLGVPDVPCVPPSSSGGRVSPWKYFPQTRQA